MVKFLWSIKALWIHFTSILYFPQIPFPSLHWRQYVVAQQDTEIGGGVFTRTEDMQI